jgi:predicted transposase YdaD
LKERCREKGRIEGMKQGIQEGREYERRQIVRKMSSIGIASERIGEFFGIPVSEVTELLKSSE